jgi:hypothetical protein
VLVIVLFSPGWLMTLVMVEPGKVAYSVNVCLPPGAVKVEPGRVVVRYSVSVVRSPGAVCTIVGPEMVRVMMDVRTTEWLNPGAVWKLVKVEPGDECVTVIVSRGLDGLWVTVIVSRGLEVLWVTVIVSVGLDGLWVTVIVARGLDGP